ncbi:LytTR family DNA-binding domain-containing protein [Pelagicoccus enzymogenes]|uniref:LytR/AlgR family response regulator transcription factor n=1 Tax=Pelagicoccus enzymogenes TaxID=2773457 RepID=UPI0031F2E196
MGKLASTWPADTSDSKNKSTQPLASDSQVFVKDGDRCWFVKLIDIRLFEVEGSYTRIHFSDQKPMIPKSLNQLESRLDPSIFFRGKPPTNRQSQRHPRH